MESMMDIDMAWCLTCSMRTESNKPYCSDACRNADTAAGVSSASKPVVITSTIPATRLISPPRPSINHTSASPTKSSTPIRPPLTPVTDPVLPSSLSHGFPGVRPEPRNRRAFSFPAPQSTTPISLTEKRLARQSQAILPAFNRKPHALSYAFIPSPGNDLLRPPIPAKISKSTGGANTPLDPESVFCSTSESGESEPEKPIDKPQPPSLSFHRKPSKASQTKPRISPPDLDPLGSLRSKLSGATTTLNPRKSQSPVAALVASSASSRSREDIISWARAVGYRPGEPDGEEEEGEEEEERGRSRTRRAGASPKVVRGEPPMVSPEEGIMGTTPKGRIGSALAGFRGFGVGPIVKALTSVTGSRDPIPPPSPIPSSITKTLSRNNTGEIVTIGLGLQAVTPQTEVSRIAVVASTNANLASDEPLPQQYYSGATPTLSTISLSEAIEPSIVDNPENVDMINSTDDQYSTTSYQINSRTMRGRRASAAQQLAKTKQANASSESVVPSLSIRPIATIWSISNYLRSFSPFANTVVTVPPVPAIIPTIPLGATVVTIAEAPSAPSPLPTNTNRKSKNDVETSPKTEMVRSLPMDIIIPGTKNPMPIIREAPLPSPRASRSRVRSRDREQSRRPARSPSRSSSISFGDEGDRQGRHGRKWSYDADGDGEESDVEDARRGRSRRGKILPSAVMKLEEELEELDGDGEEGRGRGRGRERQRAVRAVA